MKIKLISFYCVLFYACSSSSNQRTNSIKILENNNKINDSLINYFIPPADKNKASFHTPADKENGILPNTFAKDVFYTNSNDTFQTYEATYANGENGWVTESIVRKSILITDTALFIINKTLTNALGTTNETKEYDPPYILLKIPAENHNNNWTAKDDNGSKTSFSVSWDSVYVLGLKRKSIKLREKNPLGIEDIYYAKNIGYCKEVAIPTNGRKFVLSIIDKLDYNSAKDEKGE